MSTADERTRRLSRLSPAKKALLEKWVQGETTSASFNIIPRRVETDLIPLSFTQEWNSRHPSSESSAILLQGPLEKDVLERSYNELIRRHETLRTTYPLIDGTRVPTIAPSARLSLAAEDLETWPESERMDQAMSIAREEMHHRQLDLEHGPVFHARLLRLSSEQHLLVVVLSKMITDEWAQPLFFRELREIYDAFADGQPSPLPELSIQYSDFAAWQRHSLQGAAWDAFLAYWQEQLMGAPKLALPTDFPRTPDIVFQENQVRFTVPDQLAEQLRALSRSENSTLFMTLFAVFQLLIHHFTGQRDIVIGIDTSSRSLPETEKLIGVFTHQLPVRMRIADDLSFRTLLGQLRGVILDVYAHQGVPLGLLIEKIGGSDQDLQAQAVLGASVAYVNENMLLSSLTEETLTFSAQKPKLVMISQPLVDHADQEDLNLQIRDTAKDLKLDLVYHVHLYRRETIARLVDSYHKLLVAIAASPDSSVSELLQILRVQDTAKREENP